MPNQPDPQPPLALGIDIGGGSAKLALLDDQRETVATGQSAEYRQPTLEALARVVRDALDAMLAGQPVETRARIERVGLSAPGPVEGDRHIVISGNVPALSGLDGVAWVERVMGAPLPTRVVTDQLAAAMSQWMNDPLAGRALYLALGTGVGGAILDHGHPLTFTRGTPGHLGHLDVSGGDPDAPTSEAAGRGALEAYVGAPALRAAGMPVDDPRACVDHPAMPRATAALARAIRICLALYRMDHVVLMGGIAQVFLPVLDRVRDAVLDDLSPVAPDVWSLSVGNLGPMAGAIGASQMA
jgi:glucokinase